MTVLGEGLGSSPAKEPTIPAVDGGEGVPSAHKVLACIECGSTEHRLTTGREVYSHRPDLYGLPFFKCGCGAFVGCHPGTKNPLGAPAGKRTKGARSDAHKVFDRLWKHKRMGRSEAYRWLADQLGIDAKACHIGHMDYATARRAVEAVQAWEAANIVRETRKPIPTPSVSPSGCEGRKAEVSSNNTGKSA